MFKYCTLFGCHFKNKKQDVCNHKIKMLKRIFVKHSFSKRDVIQIYVVHVLDEEIILT